MAPLPQNNTARLFVDYITGSQPTSSEHTFAMRYNSANNDADTLATQVYTFLQAIGATNFRAGWKVIRLRQQQAGALFTIPQGLTTQLAAFVGTNTSAYSARLEAVEDTFQGRSLVSGRRVDVSLYRAAGDCDPNFRVLSSGTGVGLVVQNAVAALAVAGNNGRFLAIDGSAPSWYPYMNENYNSYWEGQLRTS